MAIAQREAKESQGLLLEVKPNALKPQFPNNFAQTAVLQQTKIKSNLQKSEFRKNPMAMHWQNKQKHTK